MFEMETELKTEGLYLCRQKDRLRLTALSLLLKASDEKFVIPKLVSDAVAAIDMKY